MPRRYQWQPLAENRIRLFEIVPGNEDTALHFFIEHHDLASLPEYEAISYAVGDSPADCVCVCQGSKTRGTIHITTSLWLALQEFRRRKAGVNMKISSSLALQRFRRRKQRTFVWADQICIDQNNAADKARQIPLMSNIFGSATMVFVWLGPANEDTAQAFRLVNSVTKKIYANSKGIYVPAEKKLIRSRAQQLLLPHHTAHEWKALNDLFKRSWFRRQWCFQEIVIAKKATVLCGTFDIPWEALSDALEAIIFYDETDKPWNSFLKAKAHRPLLWTGICRRAYQVGRRRGDPMFDLMHLTVMCMDRGAALPHDKIYALLGCARGDETQPIPIDYQQHFRRLYSNSTRVFLQKRRKLGLLRLVQHCNPATGPTELPHWVPDYRYKPDERELINGTRVDLWIAMQVKDFDYNATGSSRAIIPDTGDPLLLSLEGFSVGKIIKTTEMRPPIGDHSVVESAKDIVAGEPLALECCTDGIYLPTGEPIYGAYLRTLVLDRPHSQEASAQRTARTQRSITGLGSSTCTHAADRENPNSYDDVSDVGKILCVHVSPKILFITDSGYIGLATQSCTVGDQVYLLLGGDMPFILRELSIGTFQYAGEAYVHGIMDGEYLLRFRQHSADNDALTDEEWLDSLGDENPPPLPAVQVVLS